MKTKGITHVCASTVLSVLLLIFVSKSSAQVNFTFQRSISFGATGNSLAAGPMGDYAFEKKTARGEPLISASLFSYSSSTGRHDKAKATTVSFNNDNKNSPSSGNKYKKTSSNSGISFKSTCFTYPKDSRTETGLSVYPPSEILYYAKALKEYAKENGYDTSYAFFSNMGMLSGKKRFFAVNLVTMQIEQSGLVSQGRGLAKSRYDKQYSNIVDSKCTSLGRYKIMGKYRGIYGDSYRMSGLDSTNSNAYKRNIVLHSMSCIPEEESNSALCISEGCPAVSDNFFSSLSRIIDSRKKPMLLWVYDSNLEEVIIQNEKATSEHKIKDDKSTIKYHQCAVHSYQANSTVEW